MVLLNNSYGNIILKSSEWLWPDKGDNKSSKKRKRQQ